MSEDHDPEIPVMSPRRHRGVRQRAVMLLAAIGVVAAGLSGGIAVAHASSVSTAGTASAAAASSTATPSAATPAPGGGSSGTASACPNMTQ